MQNNNDNSFEIVEADGNDDNEEDDDDEEDDESSGKYVNITVSSINKFIIHGIIVKDGANYPRVMIIRGDMSKFF